MSGESGRFEISDVPALGPAEDYVRRHPEFFVPAAPEREHSLVLGLIRDALVSGIGDIRVLRCDDQWLMVCSSQDWITTQVEHSQTGTMEFIFQHVIKLNARESIYARSEVALAAFAKDVSWWWCRNLTTFKGKAPPPELVALMEPYTLAVVFRL